jgi:hypothetical protein
MIGQYKGFYKFNSPETEKLRGIEKTIFYCTIDFFDGKNFSGSIEDDPDSGGMMGVGKIVGKLRNGQITFVKKMPIRMIIQHSEALMEVSPEPHPPIYYKGKLSSDKRYFYGTWAFNHLIAFFYGIIPKTYRPPSGTWEMHPIKNEK